MDLGTAVGAIKLMYDGSGADQARQDMSSLEQSGAKANAQMAGTGLALGAMGAGALKFVSDAVMGAADVQSVMKAVEASTGASADEIQRLTDLSGQLGSDTIFSTEQVAQAADVLGKAGVSVEEQLGGSLKAVTDLAAATDESLTTAAGSVADAQAIFRLSGEDTAQVADLTTNALNASKIGLDEYNAGFRNLAPTMANFADSQEEAMGLLEDTGEVIAFFTANGLKGADAGISFARMIQNLATPTTQEYADAIKEAGINLFDAEGNFVGAEEAIRQVNDAFQGLSDQEKIELMDKLGIGAEAQDVVGIISAVGDEYGEFTDDMQSGNTAAEQAQILMSGLGGALEGLSGTMSEIMRSIGEPLLAPLEGIVRAIDFVASAFLKLPSAIQGAIGAFAGFFGVLASAAGAIMGFKAAGGLLEQFFPGVGKAALGAIGPIAAVAAVLAGLYLAYETNFLGFGDLVDNTLSKIQKTTDTFGKRFGASFGARQAQGTNQLAAAVGAFGDALKVATGIDILGYTEPLADAIQATGDAFQRATELGMNPFAAGLSGLAAGAGALGFTDIQNALVDMAGTAQKFGDTFSSIFTAAQAAGKSGPVAAVQALGGALSELIGMDVNGFFNTIAKGMENLGNNIGNLGSRVVDGLHSFFDLIGSEWGTIRDVLGELFSGDLQGAMDTLGDAFGELGGNIGDTLSQLGTSLGSAMQGIGDFLGNLDLGGKLGQLASNIGTALQNAFNAAGEFITGGGLASLVQTVSSALMDAFNAAGDWAGGIAATIGMALTNALNTIGNFLGGFNPGQMASDIGTKISEAFTNVGSFLSGVGEAIGGALSTALNTIGNFLGDFNPGNLVTAVIDKITAAFGGGGGGGIGGQEGTSGGGGAGFPGIAQSIGSALATALNAIGDYLSGFNPVEIATGIINDLQEAFTTGAPSIDLTELGTNLKNALEAACNIDLGDAFDKLGEAVSGAGTAISNAGMVISRNIEDIKAKLQELNFDEVGTKVQEFGSQMAAGMAIAQSALTGAIDTIKAKIAELNFDDIVSKVQELGGQITSGMAIVQSAFTGALSTIKSEIEKINFDAIGQAIQDFAGNLPGWLGEALGSFTGWVGDMVAQAAIIIAKIGEIGAAVKDALAPSAGLVTNYTDTVGEGIGILADLMGGGEILQSDQGAAAAQQSGDFATNYIAAVAASFANADWSPVANAINAGLAGITSGSSYSGQGGPRDMGPSAGGIGETFVTGFIQQIVAAFTPEAFAPVKTAFDAALNTALSGAGAEGGGGEGATGQAALIIGKLFNDMVSVIDQNKERLAQSMTSALDSMRSAVDQGVTGIQTSFQAIVTAIQQIAAAAALAVGQMNTSISSAMATLQASINTAVTGIQTSLQAIVTAIQQISASAALAVGEMNTAITSAFQTMQESVNSAVSSMQASVQAIVTALQQTATAAGEAAASIGTAIVGALEAAVPAVEAAAAALGAAATVPIVGAILPGSPSRVIMPVAESVPEAITTAYEQGMPAVEDAAADLGAAATDGVTDAVTSTADGIATELEGQEPVVEDAMTSMVTSATDAAASHLAEAADLFSQFGLTFGNDMGTSAAEGADQAMSGMADKLRSNAEELRSSIMERVKKMHEGFLPDANTVIGQRNPWAAKLMSDQNITVNVEAMLDGEKMADWTTDVTLGGMLGVKDSGGRRRGLSPTA